MMGHQRLGLIVALERHLIILGKVATVMEGEGVTIIVNIDRLCMCLCYLSCL